MKKRDWINLSLLLVVLIAGYLLHRSRTYEHKRSWLQLDTFIEVTVISNERNWDSVMDSLSQLIDRLESEFSYHKTESRLYRINHAQDSVFTITPEFYQILSMSRELHQSSDGLFDLTIGPLTDIWNIDNEVIPDQTEISKAQERIGFEKISFTDTTLNKPVSTKLNLGGIAKGFIIDRMADFLAQKGALSAIINVGGDILLFGQEKSLRIGIQHPRKERNEIIDVIAVQNGAVVTSGDYERYFIQAGKRYHHIIDPFTGFPATQCLSVTVIADNAMTADAYSTAFFLMGPDRTLELAEKLANLEVMVYYMDGNEIAHRSSTGFSKFLVNNKEGI